MKFILYIIIASCAYISCTTSDEKKIIGKWKSDADWFEFKQDMTYDAGKEMLTMVKGFRYILLPKEKKMTMYTDDKSQTYYLHYSFAGSDTLYLQNILNNENTKATFVRVNHR